MEARRRLLMQSKVAHLPVVWNGDDFSWVSGKYIGQTNNSTAGKEGNTRFYKAVLDYIPCEILANRSVSISGSGISSTVLISCAFYADNNEASYISAITSNNTAIAPKNVRYCRLCIGNNTPISNFYLTTND